MTDTHTEALVERVARASAGELGKQDFGEPFELKDDLKVAYLDQGEVDFGLVARAAIEALPARNDERALKLVEAVTDEGLARLFHETYERLAPSFNYQTRKASAVPWADVPPNNKALMIAVCHHVRAALASQPSQEQS
jgi:hypothetical protein